MSVISLLKTHNYKLLKTSVVPYKNRKVEPPVKFIEIIDWVHRKRSLFRRLSSFYLDSFVCVFRNITFRVFATKCDASFVACKYTCVKIAFLYWLEGRTDHRNIF